MKNFEGLQATARESILMVVGPNPISVGQIARSLRSLNNEDFVAFNNKQFRQFIQNTVDRLVRHGQLQTVKGFKKTGRPVNHYQLVSTEPNVSNV